MPAAEIIKKALRLLGVRNFTLGIHDAAFPGLATEDLGRGSPYSEAAAQFFEFAAALGFNSVQLGPQGITTAANPSPYDGSFFSRNPLSLAAQPLVSPQYCLLKPATLDRLIRQRPGRMELVDDRFSRWAQGMVLAEIAESYRRNIKESSTIAASTLYAAYTTYRQKNSWLLPDALYQVLRRHYGGRTWRKWGEDASARLDQHLFAPQQSQKTIRDRLDALQYQHAQAIDDYCFIQFLLAEQHQSLRSFCRRLDLKLFGDLQIGMSGRDAWAAQAFLLPDYVMGAPPSRTNPLGQPWNYPLLDPRRYYSNVNRQPGPGLLFVRQRLEKIAGEFDGLRLDHPHGLICPWVYKAGQLDPWYAVQHGARLFASPDLPDHPALAEYAIALPEQLNRELPRYADDWVAALDPEQLNHYSELFVDMMETLNHQWCGDGEIICEILSTQPYPVKQVLQRYGLGRMRVTQKADLGNPADVYRSENAQPQDWLMLGNHDTPPIRQVVEKWLIDGSAGQQAEYLAQRLAIPAPERSAWIERHAFDPAALVQAKFADLFLGPAQNIMIFFVDLLGGTRSYNRPGTIGLDNWMLRVPPDYKQKYAEKLSTFEVLNIPYALAMALRAKVNSYGVHCSEHHELIRQLEVVDKVI